MAAVNSLLLLLTTIAPYNNDPPGPWTSPPFWNDTSPLDVDGGVLPRCAPFLEPEGERACPLKEHYEECGEVCIRSCIQYDCPLKCCLEGCFCDEGLVRGIDGSCILEEECPPPPPPYTPPPRLYHDTNRIDEPGDYQNQKECGPDEYISCESQCQRNCSNYHDVIICDKMCILDCVCVPPKIRGPRGDCILPQQCGDSTPPAESKKSLDKLLICNYIRMMSPEDPRCSKTAMPCKDPFGCPGAIDEDYDLDDIADEITDRIRKTLNLQKDGNDAIAPCFPDAAAKGPETCGANEHYEECGALCMETCFEYECPLRCCVEGCFCDEGFVRDPSHHTCIPKEQCSGHRLFNRISSNQNKGSEEVEEDPTRCAPGELLTCHSKCERTCDNFRDEHRKCPDECHMGCVCLPPKVRGPEGACIYPRQCPPTRERMLEEHMKVAAIICNFVRIMGNPPAWADSCPMIVHECTDPEECFGENASPPLLGQSLICRKDERLTVLPSCPVTCDNFRDPSKNCKMADMVVPRCDCKQGLVRDAYGGCVPENACNSRIPVVPPASPELLGQRLICGDDLSSRYSVSKLCPLTCDNYRDPPQICSKRFTHRCDCLEGLIWKDHYGALSGCIPPEECPKKEVSEENSPHLQGQSLICPKNTYLNVFPSCPVTCDNYRNKTKECKITDVIVPRCDCKRGFVKGPHGECIPPENCPNKDGSKKCPEHEEWRPCGSHCPRTCQNYDEEIHCIDACKEGCFCKEPRVRGPDRTCVLTEECPTKSTDAPPCPEILCRKGYFLEAKAKPCPKCVECPLVNCLSGCRLDMDQEPCPTCVCDGQRSRGEASFQSAFLLVPDNCQFEHLHNSSLCQGIDAWIDAAASKCLDRGLRLRNSSMLLPCSTRGLFAGIQFVCCPRNVPEENSSPHLQETKPCPQILCRKGYYLDARAKPCPKCRECPLVNCLRGCRLDTTQEPCPTCVCDDQVSEVGSMQCGPNEYFGSYCGSSCFKNCTNFDQDEPVGPGCRHICTVGCFCKEDYVIGPDGECILPANCPQVPAATTSDEGYSYYARSSGSPVCPPNERYSDCGTLCPKNCSNFDGDIVCPAVCVQGCFCKGSMVRGPRGKCIETRECPQVPAGMTLRQYVRSYQSQSCPDIECGEGSYLDFYSTSCPECRACPQIRCKRGCYLDSRHEPCPRCVCYDNQEEQSAAVCSKDEYWDDCGSACPKTCSNRGRPGPICPAVCKRGCFCKSPLVRGPRGDCIPVRDCP